MTPPTPLPDETTSTKPFTPVLDSLSSSDSDSDSDIDATSVKKPSPQQQQTEWLATSRTKRSTAGNRMKALLANEAPLLTTTTTSTDADADDLELLFAEDEDDAGFTPEAKDDASDVQMDSSSDEEDNDAANADEDEGEKELERQAREKRAAQRKRKTQEAIPAKFRKKVRIEPPGSSNAGSTVASPAPKPPRPKKKSERASWLPTLADMPTRASERSTTRMSKQQLHEKMVTDEIRRRKQIERMEKKAKLLEAMKKPPMTQAERLAEAAKVEKRNARSLNRWEEAEKQREEERLKKIAALNSRKLDGPVVTFWSGIQELSEGQGKHVGNLVSMEERAPRKKRQSAAAVLAAKEMGVGEEPGTPTTTPVEGEKMKVGGKEGEVKAEKVDAKMLAGTVPTETPNAGTTAAPVNSPAVPVATSTSATQGPVFAPTTEPPVSVPATQPPSTAPVSAPAAPLPTPLASPAPAVSAPASTPTPPAVAMPAPPPPVAAPAPVPALGTFQPPVPSPPPPPPPPAQIPTAASAPPSGPVFAPPLPPTTSVSPPKGPAAPVLSMTPPTAPSMAPPPIPPPPEARPPTSGVLAAPILAPPPGPMLGAQMPMLGFPPSGGKSNVLALPNTSHTPSPLSMPLSAPAVPAPALPILSTPTMSAPVPPTVPKLNIPAPPIPSTPAQQKSAPAQTPVSATPVSATPISAAPVSATPTTAKQPDTPQSALPQSTATNPEPPAQDQQPQGKVTRSCIILQNFDDAAIKDKQIQNQILFGRKMNRLAKPAHPPLCVITNHPARYRDPKTGLHYYNSYAYKEIQRVSRGDYKWSSLLGSYVGRGWGEFAAKGVPERFTDPSRPSGIVAGGEKPEEVGVVEARLVPIEGAEPVVKMEGGGGQQGVVVPAAAPVVMPSSPGPVVTPAGGGSAPAAPAGVVMNPPPCPRPPIVSPVVFDVPPAVPEVGMAADQNNHHQPVRTQ